MQTHFEVNVIVTKIHYLFKGKKNDESTWQVFKIYF